MSDLLKVTTNCKAYTVIQNSAGYVTAFRNGEPWRDCVGDNLVLSLAQTIESLRSKLTEMTRERDELKEREDFLKSKGLTVGKMKTSDKPDPYLVYVIEPDSELCNLKTVNKLIDAEIKIKSLQKQIAAKDGALRIVHCDTLCIKTNVLAEASFTETAKAIENIRKISSEALSPDCGKEWVRKSEVEKLEKSCAEMRHELWSMLQSPLTKNICNTRRNKIESIISSDCGKDYIHKSRAEAAEAKVGDLEKFNAVLVDVDDAKCQRFLDQQERVLELERCLLMWKQSEEAYTKEINRNPHSPDWPEFNRIEDMEKEAIKLRDSLLESKTPHPLTQSTKVDSFDSSLDKSKP